MALSVVGGFGSLAPIFFGIYGKRELTDCLAIYCIHKVLIRLYKLEGVGPDKIARLLTWPSLFTGLGNFVFLPLALIVGR